MPLDVLLGLLLDAVLLAPLFFGAPTSQFSISAFELLVLFPTRSLDLHGLVEAPRVLDEAEQLCSGYLFA